MGERQRIWLPLSEAMRAFASVKLREDDILAHSAPFDRVRDPPMSPEQAMADFINSARTFNERLQAVNSAVWAMQQALIAGLIRGKFEARGIRAPASPKLVREQIPSQFFEGRPKLKWDRGSASNLGIAFEHVEVRRVAKVLSLVARSGRQEGRSEPGRPSKVDRVIKAINAVTARGEDLNAIKRKVAYNRIRAELTRTGIDVSIGFSDPVIQRALVLTLGKRGH